MVVRAAKWSWSRTGLQRLALVLLWLGHGTWVLLGPNPARHWMTFMDVLSRPSQSIAARWEGWRAARRDSGRSLAELRAENARLGAELTQFRTQQAQQAPRLAEADEAVRMLGLKQQIPLELKSARVLFATRPATFGGLILDRGQDLGLEPDQGVLVPEGIVGRLWSVGATQSKVLPADAPNASVAVMLMRSRATGVLQGLGSGRALIRYVSNQEVVQAGEAVLTSGLDRVFPRGLLVGYVAEVAKGDLELRVIVHLSAPLDRVNAVLVLPPQPPLEVQPPFVAPEPKTQQRKRGAP
ncbi:MAG: rod shape-determining protein MreC [Geothrix sp.]|uniref:rod shape-determining protein MreC n=1 Tax=Geothrix sp. TaxID=1962974 RepID=UPI0018406D8C|nr:rod shape-determining protein MreC [Geothrix sp.]NWJ40959.1 rod shape-determining protein MreC [Geothrix sp.]